MNTDNTFLIVIPIYKGVDLMDVCAPKEIFGWAKKTLDGRDIAVLLVAKNKKPVITRDGTKLLADRTFLDQDVQNPSMFWIPGGAPPALNRLIAKPKGRFFSYMATISGSAEYRCSVCEGAILFAQTGMLNGHDATTHWAFYTCFDKYNKNDIRLDPTYPKYVHSGKCITGGGISSGIDQAFYLLGLIAGKEAAQSAALMMQYAPVVEFPITIVPATSCPLDKVQMV